MHEKILIVDDEEGMVSFIRDALVSEGYEVNAAYDGEEAVRCAMKHPDLIILDIMLPGKDGFEVCQQIRDVVSCPILFLSAMQGEMDRIKGLAVGGDDYIVKPFSLRELKMRVQAHLRREKRVQAIHQRSYLRYGGLSIDLQGHAACYKDIPIYFTPREFDIVEMLALHPGLVFSKDQIYEKIWGYDSEGDSAGVAEHVKKIRAKLNEFDADHEYIVTVWGVGYKWQRIK